MAHEAFLKDWQPSAISVFFFATLGLCAVLFPSLGGRDAQLHIFCRRFWNERNFRDRAQICRLDHFVN